MVIELTMGCITCCWGNEIEAGQTEIVHRGQVHVHEGGKDAELPTEIENRNDHMTVHVIDHLNLASRPVK